MDMLKEAFNKIFNDNKTKKKTECTIKEILEEIQDDLFSCVSNVLQPIFLQNDKKIINREAIIKEEADKIFKEYWKGRRERFSTPGDHVIGGDPNIIYYDELSDVVGYDLIMEDIRDLSVVVLETFVKKLLPKYSKYKF